MEAITAAAMSEKSFPNNPGKKNNGEKAAIVVIAEPDEERAVSETP